MVNQITIKPIGLIQDFKMYVHGIPYIARLIIIQNNVVECNYFMLLGRL